MVMVANKKSQDQMTEDLSLFLGNNTIRFTVWYVSEYLCLRAKSELVFCIGGVLRSLVHCGEAFCGLCSASLWRFLHLSVGNSKSPALCTCEDNFAGASECLQICLHQRSPWCVFVGLYYCLLHVVIPSHHPLPTLPSTTIYKQSALHFELGFLLAFMGLTFFLLFLF